MATWGDDNAIPSDPLLPEGPPADPWHVDPASAAAFLAEVAALAASLARFVEIAESIYPKLKLRPGRGDEDTPH